MKKLLSSLLFVVYALFFVPSVHAMQENQPVIIIAHPGGDCFANRATGDTWKIGNEWFCGVVPSSNEPNKSHKSLDTVSPVPDTVNQSDNTNQTVLNVPSVPVDDSTPIVQDESKGNPGNDKPVGNAGEKCDKGMCENSDGASGEHGKSNND